MSDASAIRTVRTQPGGHQHLVSVTGVEAKGFVFFSAIRGTDPETGVPSADVRRQADQLFDNLEVALQGAGLGLEDVARVGIFVKDLAGDRPVFNEVWKQRFTGDGPSRFAVEVADLGAPGDDSRFLVEVIAVRP